MTSNHFRRKDRAGCGLAADLNGAEKSAEAQSLHAHSRRVVAEMSGLDQRPTRRRTAFILIESPWGNSTAPLRGPRWTGKPGSVVERHSSGMDVASHLKQPTRRLGRVNPRRLRGAPAYLVLLPGGFAMPVLLPVRRWALTPPFHPYLIRFRGHRRFVLCCTVRRVTPPWCYQAQHPAEPGLSSVLANSDALVHEGKPSTGSAGPPHGGSSCRNE